MVNCGFVDPNVVPGYWNNSDADAASFINGYWRSGDIGRSTNRAMCGIFDRIKDMINRAGLKVYCAEVENVLNNHPYVLECAVVGRPDPFWGAGACVRCSKVWCPYRG